MYFDYGFELSCLLKRMNCHGIGAIGADQHSFEAINFRACQGRWLDLQVKLSAARFYDTVTTWGGQQRHQQIQTQTHARFDHSLSQSPICQANLKHLSEFLIQPSVFYCGFYQLRFTPFFMGKTILTSHQIHQYLNIDQFL